MENTRKKVVIHDRGQEETHIWLLTADQIRLLERLHNECILDNAEVDFEVKEDSDIEAI